MDNTKYISRGFNATLPPRVQIRNIIENMQKMRDRQDIRKYPESARKELLQGGTIDVLTKDGATIIGVVPKLALVVVSPVFREYLQEHPDIASVKISKADIDAPSVAFLLDWINNITNSTGKLSILKAPHKPTNQSKNGPKYIGTFGVAVPSFPDQLIKVYHAALELGMDMYVTHFWPVYKDGLRQRWTTPDECHLLERYSARDGLLGAFAERLGYLRRTGQFSKEQVAHIADVLDACPKIGQAVRVADARSDARRNVDTMTPRRMYYPG